VAVGKNKARTRKPPPKRRVRVRANDRGRA